MNTSQNRNLKIRLNKKPGMRDSQVIHDMLNSQEFIPQMVQQSQHFETIHEHRQRLDSFTESRIYESFTSERRRSFHESENSDLFTLPIQVVKLLESFEESDRQYAAHVEVQKSKIEDVFTQFTEDIIFAINKKKHSLLDSFDMALELYRNNFRVLLRKIQEFKQSFTMQCGLPDLIVNVQQLNYYITDDRGEYFQFKEEQCDLKAKLTDIDQELTKRQIQHISENIQVQFKQKMRYDNSETAQILFHEIKESICKEIERQIDIKELLIQTDQHNFENLLLLPKIQTVISDSRQNAMGGDRDLQELKNLKELITQKLKQPKTRMNISLGLGQAQKNFGMKLQSKIVTNHTSMLYSLLAVNDSQVLTGSRDGCIKIWNIIKNEQISSFHTRQPVSCMRLFKGFEGDFNVTLRVLNSKSNLKECTYLITGNLDMRIWDLTTGTLLRQFSGHNGIITALMALKDMHTIISGGEDGKLIFWNAYSGLAMKKIVDNRETIHAIVVTKQGRQSIYKFRIVTGSSDRSINIYQIQYVKSQIYGRLVFGDCQRVQQIIDEAQIYCLCASMIDEHLLISGGSDSKVKVWNTKTKTCTNEILGHRCPIGDMVLLENPLDVDDQKMFCVISASTGEDVLRLSTSISPLNSGIYIDEKIINEFAATCSPIMQLVQDPIEKSLKLVVLNQEEDRKQFLVLKLL